MMDLFLEASEARMKEDVPDLGGEGSKTLKICKLGSVGEVEQKVGQVWTSLITMVGWVKILMRWVLMTMVIVVILMMIMMVIVVML